VIQKEEEEEASLSTEFRTRRFSFTAPTQMPLLPFPKKFKTRAVAATLHFNRIFPFSAKAVAFPPTLKRGRRSTLIPLYLERRKPHICQVKISMSKNFTILSLKKAVWPSRQFIQINIFLPFRLPSISSIHLAPACISLFLPYAPPCLPLSSSPLNKKCVPLLP
jgi:hypothetical protein